MIDIGSTNFLIKVPSLSEKDFELYSSDLFDQWEVSVEKNISLPDYAISLEIEEGSISGRAKIAAAASVVYLGVATYGSFITGLQTIRSQISYVNNVLFESAKYPFDCSKDNITVRNSGGAISKLQSLFQKVQKGTLTPDEATLMAMEIFGEETEDIPDLAERLKKEMENAPRYPEQLNLIEEESRECEEATESITQKPPKKRTPKPMPISEQYRIEIWRESKKDKKHVKFTRK